MLIPVILCGGSGNRLWPLSRDHYPKQLLALTGDQSLLQQTARRAQQIVKEQSPIIIANHTYRFQIAAQLAKINMTPRDLILEPCAKNTAPALGLAALQALTTDDDAILLVMPSDHLLPNTDAIKTAIDSALALAKQGKLITFGITPTYPESGYGYINAADEGVPGVFHVNKFVEKPNAKIARDYLKTGHHYWNSGIFLFSAKAYLTELKHFANEIYQNITTAHKQRQQDLGFTIIPNEIFSQCPSDSIDYAVLEHTQRAMVVPLTTAWTDIGSWLSLWNINTADSSGNVTKGDVITQDTENCYIRAEDRLVATIGIKNQIIVETADAILIADKNQSQAVKTIVTKLKQQQRSEVVAHKTIYRPWGHYQTLSTGPGYQVKCITVYPKSQLSLQSHDKRAEHWTIVSGIAHVQRDQKTFTLSADQSTYIPRSAKHQLTNQQNTPLIIIEVQTGEYFGDDDITRFENAAATQPLEPSYHE